MPDGGFSWGSALTWAWGNRTEILGYLKQIWPWFKSGSGRGILIIGPGGVGKTTLARLLSGDFDWLLDEPWRYDESYGIEHTTLRDDPKVAVVVPPGQHVRREATWGNIQDQITAGRYRGVILVSAGGYHSIGVRSYKRHALYQGNKDEFLTTYTATCRRDEVDVLRRMLPHLRTASGKVWLLSVVTKEDLWWPDRRSVEQHYTAGDYAAGVTELASTRGQQAFRHELVTTSLVIGNFVTGEGELLRKNTEGYDHRRQVESVRRLFEAVKALMDWEAA